MSAVIHYTIGEYAAVLLILLFVLYVSLYFTKDHLASRRSVLWIFYTGVLLLFGVMAFGFLERNGWLFFGALVLQAFWMAWIRKRLKDNDDDSK